MIRHTPLLAGLLCLGIISCRSGYEVEPQGSCAVGFCLPDNSSGIEVSSGGGTVTKTSINSDGLSASWSAGDKLAVWAKNSAGTYQLDNTVFSVYGINGGLALFTATLASAMPQGDYTYYATYPEPVSVSGTTATFNIPSVQDGRAGGGADILIADPMQASELEEVKELSDYTKLDMSMEHILHQFRFFVPETADLFGEKVRQIRLTMPYDIAGTVSADFTDPSANLSISGGCSTINAEITGGISYNADATEYACIAVYPAVTALSSSDYMNLQVYSDTYKIGVEPISLSGRTFLAGHSTPVRIVPASSQKYYRLIFTVGTSHIGEAVRTVSISDGSSTIYSYTNTSGQYDNIVITEEYLGDDGRTTYESICNAVSGGTATLTYETENASVNIALPASAISQNGNIASISLGDVPYLLYEDFLTAKSVAHDDAYSGSADSDRTTTGYLLNDYLSRTGWNASRFSILEGDCARINCRYQSGAWFVERWCGRLDTPAMSYLKSGASVKLRIEFDYAFYIPNGYNRNDTNEKVAYFSLGTHTNSESSALEAVNSDKISGNCTVVYESDKYASGDVSKMNHASLTVNACTSSTRFVVFANTTRTTKHVASNACYYVYLDNIKVYIDK